MILLFLFLSLSLLLTLKFNSWLFDDMWSILCNYLIIHFEQREKKEVCERNGDEQRGKHEFSCSKQNHTYETFDIQNVPKWGCFVCNNLIRLNTKISLLHFSSEIFPTIGMVLQKESRRYLSEKQKRIAHNNRIFRCKYIDEHEHIAYCDMVTISLVFLFRFLLRTNNKHDHITYYWLYCTVHVHSLRNNNNNNHQATNMLPSDKWVYNVCVCWDQHSMLLKMSPLHWYNVKHIFSRRKLLLPNIDPEKMEGCYTLCTARIAVKFNRRKCKWQQHEIHHLLMNMRSTFVHIQSDYNLHFEVSIGECYRFERFAQSCEEFMTLERRKKRKEE